MNYLALILAVIAIYWWRTPIGAAQGPLNVALKNAAGEEIGNAILTPLAKGVRLVVDVKGLTPGEHAIHFHENGTCAAPKFDSAGGHFAPGTKTHGFDVKGGHHAGDMPNLIVPASGAVKVEIVNTEVTLAKGPASLLKKGGTALVIHAGPDDYKSQPAGNSGDRVACGEVKPSSGGASP